MKRKIFWLMFSLIFLTGLVGVLGPMIISPRTGDSRISAAAMQGRKLFVAIMQANVDRETAGFPDIWPRTAGFEASPDGKDDVSCMTFTDSTSYFKVIFDMPAYGTDAWAPYVADVDVGVLKRSKDSRFCDWIVAANISEKDDDFIPVLVSSNVDPSVLKNLYDGQYDERIPFGSKVGRTHIPWGDDAVVVVRKNGSSQVFKRRYFTYKNLYPGRSFSLPNLRYLDIQQP